MTAREARIDIRTTKQAKGAIDTAASFLGITTSAFMMTCAMVRATEILEEAQHIHLNAAESHRFIELLENPPAPNENLKRLFKLHTNQK